MSSADRGAPAERVDEARPTRKAMVANLLAFYAGWFAAVLGAAHGLVLPGLAIAACVVVAHVATRSRPARSVRLVVAAIALGVVVDGATGMAGLASYHSWDLPPPLPPSWILALWALFATTFDVSLRWLVGRPVLAAALGLLGGPASYLAGEGLGALTVPGGAPGLAALAPLWAAALWALTRLARWAQADGGGTKRSTSPQAGSVPAAPTESTT